MIGNKEIKIYELSKKEFFLLGTPKDLEKHKKTLLNEQK